MAASRGAFRRRALTLPAARRHEYLDGACSDNPAVSIHAVLESVLHGEVPALAGSPAIVAADRVFHRALAKAAVDRYPTAAAMAEDLRMVLAAAESAAGRPTRPVTRLMVLPFRLLRPDAEIDFLSFSLADAVTNSLSPLQSLVVRSTIAAARFQSAAPDLKAIASEGNVDVVLTGTLLPFRRNPACQRAAASRGACRNGPNAFPGPMIARTPLRTARSPRS